MTGLAQTLYLFVFTHPAIVFVGVFAAAMAFDRLVGLHRRHLDRLLYACGGVTAATMLLATIVNMVAPGFFYATSGSVLNTAAAFHAGAPLYPDWAEGRLYSFLYGPVLFWFHQPPIWLASGTGVVPATKLWFLGVGLLGTALLVAALFRLVERRSAVLFSLLFLMALARFGETFYSNRGDSILFLLVCLCAWVCARFPGHGRALAVVIGLAAGLGAGVKLHGCLYFLPFALWGWVRFGFPWMLGAAGAGAMALALPFADPRVSPGGFIAWLQLSFAHGLEPATYLHALETGLVYAGPVAVVLLLARPRLAGFTLAFGIGALLAFALLSFPAGKQGAGAHHFIALLPVFALALALILVDTAALAQRTRPSPMPRAALGALVATAFCIGIAPAAFVALKAAPRIGDPVPDEVGAFAARFADTSWQIGFGEGFNLSDSYVAVPVLDGHLPVVDLFAAGDLAAAGVPMHAAAAHLIGSCPYEYVLIPVGQRPYAAGNGMTKGVPVADAGFRRAFLTSYSLAETGPSFDLWTCERRDAG